MKRSALLLASILSVSLALSACGGDGDSGSSSAPVTLTVFAAASLTDAFDAMKSQFESDNPDVVLTFNYAGSNTLAQQIVQGAPADVFASADSPNMDEVVSAGLAEDPQPFAENTLVVITPASNPGNVDTLADLANPNVRIAVADPSVPVGNYTLEVLDKMGQSDEYGPDYVAAVKANFVTKETSVRSILQKVELGEVDAGYVYVSDAFSSGDKVNSIEIPAKFNITAEYPIAAIKESSNEDASQTFIEFVLSPDGQAVLKEYALIPVNG